jgi:hypothetical protein
LAKSPKPSSPAVLVHGDLHGDNQVWDRDELRLALNTGYGRQPRCLLIPTSNLPDNVLAHVTQSQQNTCTSPYGGPLPSGAG